MKEIPLTQGKVAIVDDDIFLMLSKFKWYARKTGKFWYVFRWIRLNPQKSISVSMHRIILGTPKGMETDHINGNGLDNRIENLRVVTKRQNLQNLHNKRSSKYPGVYWKKSHKKWCALIYLNGRMRHIINSNDEMTAATAYRVACKVLTGVDPICP